MTVTEITTAPTPSLSEDVDAVRKTFRSGRTRPLTWRIAQLKGLLRFIDECEVDIAAAIESDLGRSPMATFMADVGPVRHEIRHAGQARQVGPPDVGPDQCRYRTRQGVHRA